MDINVFKFHSVTECNACGHVMILENIAGAGESLRGLSSLYQDHLDESKSCREWHDALSSLTDARDAAELNLNSH